MLDSWQEILDTVRANPLRTALTALSVAWGIFMLVLLLGAGNGLQNAIEKNFEDDAVNSIWVWLGQTSVPFRGHAIGRELQLTNDDFAAIRDHLPGVEHATGRFYPGGEYMVRYGEKRASFDVRACHPDHRFVERTIIREGRFIDELDLQQLRKVAVIGVDVEKVLFEGAKTSPVGEMIEIGGTFYRVVGVFRDNGDDREQRKIYIPVSTAQTVYNGKNQLHQLMVTIGDGDLAQSKRVASDLHRLLARRHDFAVDDKAAVHINNNLESFEDVRAIFTWIRVFVWLVGVGTVIAGVVGVSNIMLIAVKERTREIGVRKAVGASPTSIITLIVQEALLITSVSGVAGLLVGLALVEGVARALPDNDYFRDPSVDLLGVGLATALLVITGVLAGFFPARRAALINPVVALREG